MKEVAQLDQELTIEERNLLSVAYKNIIVSLLTLVVSRLSGSQGVVFVVLSLAYCASACKHTDALSVLCVCLYCAAPTSDAVDSHLRARTTAHALAKQSENISSSPADLASFILPGRTQSIMENRQLDREQRGGLSIILLDTRSLLTQLARAQTKGNSAALPHIKEYRTKIEQELQKICQDILDLLDQHLIKSAESGESRVFYHKM